MPSGFFNIYWALLVTFSWLFKRKRMVRANENTFLCCSQGLMNCFLGLRAPSSRRKKARVRCSSFTGIHPSLSLFQENREGICLSFSYECPHAGSLLKERVKSRLWWIPDEEKRLFSSGSTSILFFSLMLPAGNKVLKTFIKERRNAWMWIQL